MQWKALFFLLCLSGLLFGEKTSKKRSVSFLAFLQNDYVHLRNLVRSLQQLKIDEKQIILIETVPDYFKGDNIETSELFKHCHHLPYNKSCGSLAEIYDNAWRKATGDILVFLTDNVELEQDFFSAHLYQLLHNQSVGLVAPKLLNGEAQTIYTAGIDFRFGVLPSERSRFLSSNKNEKNVPLPIFPLQGYDAADERASSEAVVPAASRSLMLVSAVHLRSVGGFDANFTEGYFELDLALRLAERGHVTRYYPGSRAVVFESEHERRSLQQRSDAERFVVKHGSRLAANLRQRWELHNTTLKWNMECGSGAVLGFTTEAIGFMLALESRLPLRVEVSDLDGCEGELRKAGFPRYVQDTIVRLGRKVREPNTHNVVVIHRDPGRYSSFTSSTWSDEKDDYVIGRSMYETDTIPSDWVKKCNEIPDEIWVPSQFNVRTFTEAGVNASKLRVMPEATDVHTYNPRTAKKMTNLGIPETFAFLAIGKWEKRKDWSTLLTAYLTEFTAADNTSLLIRSRLDEANLQEYEGIVKAVLNGTERSSDDLPAVRLVTETVPLVRLPSLYRSADTFVMCAHGEGWGLPLSEAMSMALPVIATNWSGSTEFLTNSTALLLRVKSLVAGPIAGHKWAQADPEHLAQLMRYAFENAESMSAQGQRARRRMVERFSHEAVGDRVIARLKLIEPLVPAAKARRQRPPPPAPARGGYLRPRPAPAPKPSGAGKGARIKAKIN